MDAMRLRLLAAAALLALTGCGKSVSPPATEGVTDSKILAAADGEWLSYGRDYGEQRFSNLTLINDSNVSQLGLAWSADLDTARGQEATPLMHDGVLYVSTAWSMVKAYDAKTGKVLWQYQCGAGVNAPATSYTVNGKQYIAVAAGGNTQLDFKRGNSVFVFAL